MLDSSELVIRVAAFAAVLLAVATWEAIAPRRVLAVSRWKRWPGNLALAAIGAGLVRLLWPAAAVGAAIVVSERGWGIFNAVQWPLAVEVVAAVVLLDLAIYFQHVVFHAVPLLWRLHRMHHADLDFDVTTGSRFHPLEILLSMGLKLLLVAALGPAPIAVLVFEILLNATSSFNHGNVRLPPSIDRVLRLVVVTPEMHRVHHSIVRAETDSNFGFNLPWWDRLFGTYRALPAAGHEGMIIGLENFREERDSRLDRLLVQPFSGDERSPPPGS